MRIVYYSRPTQMVTLPKEQKNTWPSDKSTPEIEFTNDNMKQTKMVENWSKQSFRRLTNENGYLYMY